MLVAGSEAPAGKQYLNLSAATLTKGERTIAECGLRKSEALLSAPLTAMGLQGNLPGLVDCSRMHPARMK